MRIEQSRIGWIGLNIQIEHAIRCHTVFYCVMLFCAMLCYIIIYCATLHYIILYYTTPYYNILCHTILYYSILYYTILYYTIQYYTIQCCADKIILI